MEKFNLELSNDEATYLCTMFILGSCIYRDLKEKAVVGTYLPKKIADIEQDAAEKIREKLRLLGKGDLINRILDLCNDQVFEVRPRF